jgi:hypothetical protein
MFFLMSAPIDSTSLFARLRWQLIKAFLTQFGNVAGLLVGGTMYPLEFILVRIMKESPTTEMMICRRLGFSD